jgi:hypothetical protein
LTVSKLSNFSPTTTVMMGKLWQSDMRSSLLYRSRFRSTTTSSSEISHSSEFVDAPEEGFTPERLGDRRTWAVPRLWSEIGHQITFWEPQSKSQPSVE